jgi:hypothetical protein
MPALKATNLVPLPKGLEKRAGAFSIPLRTLFKGRKYLSPLEKSRIAHVITDTGFAKSQPYSHRDGLKVELLKMFFGGGPNRNEILKSRLMQGGLFGKGGIVHGDIAADPELFNAINKFKKGDRSAGRVFEIAREGLGSGVNVAFTLGAPAVTLAAALRGDVPYSDLASESAATVGASLLSPYGALAQAAGGGLISSVLPMSSSNPLPPPEITMPAKSVAKNLVRFEAPQPEIYLPYGQQTPII